MYLKMNHCLIIFCLIFLSKTDDCDATHCRRNGNECVDIDATLGAPRTCSQNCKPNLLSDSDLKCYDCSSSDVITNKYYTINGLSCSRSASCAGKIIQGNQCVSSCGNLYQLGDFCYKIILNSAEVSCDESKICECKYAYYIEILMEKINIIAIQIILVQRLIIIIIQILVFVQEVIAQLHKKRKI